jgi:hypothetical protein
MRKSIALFFLFIISLIVYARIDQIEEKDIFKTVDMENRIAEKRMEKEASPLDSIYVQNN